MPNVACFMSRHAETKLNLAVDRISVDPKGLKLVLEEATVCLILSTLDHQISSYGISKLSVALARAWLCLSPWRFAALRGPG
jgi:hypothetical protein